MSDVGMRAQNDVRAEASAIGAVLLDNTMFDAVVGAGVEFNDFYSPKHRHIWDAICRLHSDREPIDSVTVATELQGKGILEAIGGPSVLLELQADCPSISNAGYYAASVRELGVNRRLIQSLMTIAEDLTAATDSASREQARLRAEDTFWSVTRGSATRVGSRLVSEVVADAIGEMRSGDRVAVPTGLIDYDEALGGGYGPGLHVIAARTSVGKSAFAAGAAFNAARKGFKVSVFSLEMKDTQIARRELAALSKVSGKKLLNGDLDEPEWASVMAAEEALRDLAMTIDDSARSLDAIKSEIRTAERIMDGLDMVVVDYLQLVRSQLPGSTEFYRQVGHITSELKLLSNDMNIPIVALAQINRGPEARNDKRPMISDLRDSGNIEQDADTITLLYRDEIYDSQSMDQGIAEVHIAKQRDGQTKTIRTAFLPQYTSFKNLQR